jgi:DNA-binding GntR family transcriptional regulator
MPSDQTTITREGKPTRSRMIADDLRKLILDGRLDPGSRLNLDALRSEYSVSLSSLREAITRLVADGLVETRDQHGFRVAPISLDDLAEITQLRMELEPLALRTAITNGGLDWETDVMARLYRLNRTERKPDDRDSVREWEDAHNAFHLALIDRCDMPRLLKFCRQMMNMNDRYRHLFLQIQAEQRDLAAEHEAIALAATSRDADKAARLLEEHIEKTGAALRQRLQHALPEKAR